MKKQISWIIVLFLCIFLSDISGQYTWQKQESTVDANLIATSFIDTLHGWIATDDGTILFTSDAGQQWNATAQLENITPTKIFFRNSQLGWLTGQYNQLIDSAIIFRTTDGGSHWDPVFHRMFYKLNDLFFIDDTMGWVAGCQLTESDTLTLMMHSTDGGDHWTIPDRKSVV